MYWTYSMKDLSKENRKAKNIAMWVGTFIASVLSIYLTAFFMGVAQLENCVSHVLYYYGF